MLGFINTLRTYRYYYKTYGSDGITFYKAMKNGKEGEIASLKMPELKHPIYLRVKTSDIPTFRQVFERKEYKTDFLGKIDPKVIIDCGANIGLSSVYYANRFPNAKIYSIEPESSNFEMLKKNTANYPNVIPINAAIWNKRTKVNVADGGSGHWGFTTTENDDSRSLGFADAVSIGDLVSQFNISKIDILKIDIEGAEKEVFQSGYEDWMGITESIFIELHDWIKPDTSKTFFKAIINYNYMLSTNGELLIFKFRH